MVVKILNIEDSIQNSSKWGECGGLPIISEGREAY